MKALWLVAPSRLKSEAELVSVLLAKQTLLPHSWPCHCTVSGSTVPSPQST